MNAMILAAGRGERLRPLTDHTPKPMLHIAGFPLLDYHLRALAAADVRRVVINLSWLGQQITDAIGNGAAYGLDVRYSDEGEQALETGGGVVRALELLGDEPFLVVNGDVWTDFPYATLDRLPDDDLAHVVLVRNPAHNASGDFSVRDGRLCAIEQRSLTFSGIGLYRPEFFHGYGERFSLAVPLREHAAAGHVAATVFDGRWFDVGTLQRLGDLQRVVAGHLAARQSV